jgi:hypothetical protein
MAGNFVGPTTAIFQGDTEAYADFITRISGYAGSLSFDIYLKTATYTPVTPHVLATS